MVASYHVGQQVIERVGRDAEAREYSTVVVWFDQATNTVTTETGLEFDAFTGMRTRWDEPYRSIRDTLKRQVTP